MPVELTIGGAGYTIGPFTYREVKAAWPVLKAALDSSDLRFGDGGIIPAVSALLAPAHPELTVEAIEDRLSATELAGLVAAFPEVMRECGLLGPEPAQPS